MPVVIDNLVKRFGEKTVLDHFSCVLPDEGTVFISGRSGAGKTTLLRLLMGLLSPDGGTISGLENRRITAVFQENRLLDNRTVLKNLRLVCPRGTSDKLFSRLLADVGLAGEEQTPVRLLSGGMQRRVALVRALAAPGDVLVLDEPFKGLDEVTKAQAIRLVRQHAPGRLILLVSHDEEEARALNAVQTITINQ